jgi:LAO/AO transport system kinase
MGLRDEVTAGSPRALARALSVVEAGGAAAEELLAALDGHRGSPRTVGLTGAPGVGKSTLAQALGLAFIERGERVAVIAVDPSSPFSGGALLGDRVRMSGLLAGGAFVRSMATRGAVGGVTSATADALDVLGAAGFTTIFVETVGVGQDEVDVAGVVDTVLVVTVGGLGDDVQAAKAGLLEIADVFAVNKADRGGAGPEVAALEGMLGLVAHAGWTPPVIAVSAETGEGLNRLVEALAAHQDHLESDGRRRALGRQRAARRLEKLVGGMVWQRVSRHTARLAEIVERVAAGRSDPYAGARELIAGIVREEG